MATWKKVIGQGDDWARSWSNVKRWKADDEALALDNKRGWKGPRSLRVQVRLCWKWRGIIRKYSQGYDLNVKLKCELRLSWLIYWCIWIVLWTAYDQLIFIIQLDLEDQISPSLLLGHYILILNNSCCFNLPLILIKLCFANISQKHHCSRASSIQSMLSAISIKSIQLMDCLMRLKSQPWLKKSYFTSQLKNNYMKKWYVLLSCMTWMIASISTPKTMKMPTLHWKLRSWRRIVLKGLSVWSSWSPSRRMETLFPNSTLLSTISPDMWIGSRQLASKDCTDLSCSISPKQRLTLSFAQLLRSLKPNKRPMHALWGETSNTWGAANRPRW